MSQPTFNSCVSALSTNLEMITPELARALLKSDGNRPFRRALALRYDESMNRGAWTINGESIKIGESGRLLDGQHRLHAVILHGRPVEMLVTRGIVNEQQAFLTMDSGSKRKTADRLYGMQEKNVYALSATLRWTYRYLWGPTTQKGSASPDADELCKMLEEMPEIRDLLHHYEGFRRAGFSGSMMCALLYGASQYNQDLALRFAEQCILGANLIMTDSVYHLRSRAISNRTGVLRTPDVVMFALSIKAWNAMALRTPMKQLRHMPGVEEFPEIIGFPSMAAR